MTYIFIKPSFINLFISVFNSYINRTNYKQLKQLLLFSIKVMNVNGFEILIMRTIQQQEPIPVHSFATRHQYSFCLHSFDLSKARAIENCFIFIRRYKFRGCRVTSFWVYLDIVDYFYLTIHSVEGQYFNRKLCCSEFPLFPLLLCAT